MQPYKRKRRTRRDMFVLGGWLFADLLLGLAMLFAVANTVGQEPPTPTPTPAPDFLATAESDLAFEQAQNQATVDALQAQIDESQLSAQQTQEAANELFAASTEAANAEATRAAMTSDERATADAQATQDAVAAQATIDALATQQAESDSSLDDLNAQLATNVAQATQAASELDELATQQAEVQAIATENADSGANAQATSQAAQDALATSQADAQSAQSTAEAASQAVADAQATSNASGQQIADAEASAAALEQQVQLNSLDSNSVDATIQVSLNGVIGGDGEAIDDAIDELNTAFEPYLNGQNCRIGFVLISSRSNELGQGVELSNAIAGLIEQEFTGLLPEPADGGAPELASESIALPGTEPVGEVQLQLFLSSGCQPAG
jgi:hypothetical protein